jgi:oligoendopeptidase F
MKKYPAAWNLSLLYKGDNDPQIEKDIAETEKAFAAFEKKYKGKDFTSSAAKLKKALEEAEKLVNANKGIKAWRYFYFRRDMDSQDEAVQAKLARVASRMTEAGNKLTFFKLALGKIPPTLQKKHLKDPVLAGHRYELELVFKAAKHDLSEGEEQLAALLAQPGVTAWTNGRSKLLTAQTIRFKGKDLPMEEALKMILEVKAPERKKLQEEINKVLKSVSHYAEGELNAVYTFKKIMDERRGYAKPYSETVMNYQNDDQMVEDLIGLIAKNFRIGHRFYKLQAKLQGKKVIGYQDRSVRWGKIKRKFDFEAAANLVRESFAAYGQKYADILDSFLKNGQFDVYPRRGKKGGAYCASTPDLPTYILLNHTENLDSVSTLAHEMGHAIHGELSKKQPYRYREYTISVAEVASTFFEQVMQDKLEQELSQSDYASFLHNKVMDDLNTIFAQAAFFNAELEMHERVRKEGTLPAAEFARVMAKHLQAYLGSGVKVTEDDGYFFVRLSHLRYFFYVYSYAFGQIVSKALFQKWKEDKGYAKKIEQFLSAGGSMSPKDIFKSIGIDTSDPTFFETGLKAIEKDIAKLEKLTKKG